jgi:hypothetical protein
MCGSLPHARMRISLKHAQPRCSLCCSELAECRDDTKADVPVGIVQQPEKRPNGTLILDIRQTSGCSGSDQV